MDGSSLFDGASVDVCSSARFREIPNFAYWASAGERMSDAAKASERRFMMDMIGYDPDG